MKHPAPDTIDWSAIFAQVNIIGLGVAFLFSAIVRCCIVSRTGHSFWLGIIWSIPIVGWFFKIWLARAPWPAVRSAQTGKGKRKRRTEKKVAA